MWIQVQILPASIPIQLLDNIPGNTGEDGFSPWAPASLWETKKLMNSDFRAAQMQLLKPFREWTHEWKVIHMKALVHVPHALLPIHTPADVLGQVACFLNTGGSDTYVHDWWEILTSCFLLIQPHCCGCRWVILRLSLSLSLYLLNK